MKKKVYFCRYYRILTNMRYYLLLLIGFIALPAFAQTNRALVITIGDYPPNSGWEKIHADNDKELVINMLSQHHYSKENILCLTNSQATKAAVAKALQQLWNNVEPGDYVYLHFSCHGQQMMDDNGDEEDGLDESMVLYDAGYWYVSGKYEGENHLRDDELGKWIDRIRRKASDRGQVTVVLDACHSGTGNRENEETDYIRGTSAIFAPKGYKPSPGAHQELSLRLKQNRGSSPAVVFSACRADEINYEYFDKKNARYWGMLSYAFKEVAAETDELSIDSFTKRLEWEMRRLTDYRKSRKQTPYVECTNENEFFKLGLKRE